jgi:hypothetical protein
MAWYQRLKQELEIMGVTATVTDPGLYVIHRKDNTIYLLHWVDDILIAAPDAESVNWVKQRLHWVKHLTHVIWVRPSCLSASALIVTGQQAPSESASADLLMI